MVFGATVLVLLIGLSRLCLGVHYFSDVAAGAVWLSAVISGAETLLGKARKEPRVDP